MRRKWFVAGALLEAGCAFRSIVTGDTPWLWVAFGAGMMLVATRMQTPR